MTILDLATVQAGPYAASMLADLGARVIKIDATDKRLDEGRRSSAQALADVRTYAGKQCMQVDLQTPEGKEILHQLIAKADVLSHNYRLGVAERLQDARLRHVRAPLAHEVEAHEVAVLGAALVSLAD